MDAVHFDAEAAEQKVQQYWQAHDNKYGQDVLSIVFHSERRGVGKSTNVRTLAHCLCHVGYKVLMVDLDQERSLTWSLVGHIINTRYNGDYEAFIHGPPVEPPRVYPRCRSTIKQMLSTIYAKDANGHMHAIDNRAGEPVDYVADIPFFTQPVVQGGWMKLIVGDPDNSAIQEVLLQAEYHIQNLDEGSIGYKNVPGEIQRTVQATAKHIGADIILIDLQSSVSALVRNVYFSFHYIVACAESDSVGGIRGMMDKIAGDPAYIDNAGQLTQAGIELEAVSGGSSILRTKLGWLHSFSTSIWCVANNVSGNRTPLRRVQPKFLGYIVCMMDEQLLEGPFANGLPENRWTEKVHQMLHDLKTEFATLRVRLQQRGMALADECCTDVWPAPVDQPAQRIELIGCVGIIPSYGTKERAAQYRNTVVPFMQYKAGDFVISKGGRWWSYHDRRKFLFEVSIFRNLWLQTTWNMLQLVCGDGGNGAALPGLSIQAIPPPAPNGSPYRPSMPSPGGLAAPLFNVPFVQHPWQSQGGFINPQHFMQPPIPYPPLQVHHPHAAGRGCETGGAGGFGRRRGKAARHGPLGLHIGAGHAGGVRGSKGNKR